MLNDRFLKMQKSVDMHSTVALPKLFIAVKKMNTILFRLKESSQPVSLRETPKEQNVVFAESFLAAM